MAYELRHFDTPLLRFEVIENTFVAELEAVDASGVGGEGGCLPEVPPLHR